MSLSIQNNRIVKFIGIAVVVVVGVVGLIWYYQQQGLVDILPTDYEKKARQIAVIDETAIEPIEGIGDEIYQGQIANARNLADAVLANAESSVAWLDFGNAMSLINDRETAVKAWEVSYELQPNNPLVTSNLANTYQYFLPDYPRSEFFYLKTLELQPGNALAYEGLADLYQFNWKEMENKFEPTMLQAVGQNSDNANRYYAKLVRFFGDRDQFEKAQAYLDQLRKLDPQAAEQSSKRFPEIN